MTLPVARTVIHSARVISAGAIVRDGWVVFADGVVAATGAGRGWQKFANTQTEIVDAHGLVLTPGFIDLHCHGGASRAVDEGHEAISATVTLHRAHGTTRSILSLVTAPWELLMTQLDVIVAAAEADPLILGAHLEGPFLADSHRGAHDGRLLRAPTPDLIDECTDRGRGFLRQVTIAPELMGGAEAISRFTDAGVRVAVGHTAADYTAAREAFDAGASILTHAFNGMPGIHHRAPGPVVAALRTPHVTLEMINDGVHVHPELVGTAFAAAPGRVALITDAMAAAGASDGSYLLGGLVVRVSHGVARLEDGGSIAGSTLTLDAALRRAVLEIGVPEAIAVSAVTDVPARAIGRDDLGRLDPGVAADAVLLSEDWVVQAVWGAGERVS